MPWLRRPPPPTPTDAQIAALRDEFAQLRREFTSRFNNLTKEIHDMSDAQTTMQAALDAIRAAVTTIGTDVTALATDQAAIAQRITDLQAQIAAGGQITPQMQAQADALAADASKAATALDGVRQALDTLAAQTPPATSSAPARP